MDPYCEPLTVTRVSSIRARLLALRWHAARGDSRLGGIPPLKASRTGVRCVEGEFACGSCDEGALGSSVRWCCGRRIAAARLLSNVPSVLCRFLHAAAFAERERLKLPGLSTGGDFSEAGRLGSGGGISAEQLI